LDSNLVVEVAADDIATDDIAADLLPEENAKSTDESAAEAGEETLLEPPGEENKEGNEQATNIEQPESRDKTPARESRPRRSSSIRRYKIQEVIKRNQIVLVQVAKEERGTKGAALTTRLSLAGRYCVLMPNTARGGGISRKISLLADRKKLKTIVDSLDIPQGMAVIVRTAGLARTKAEIKRDYEYLLRLWNDIRDLTMKSSAPALINEEGNIIKRAIRDLYTREMEEVLVDSDEAYRAAKTAMRMLMPSHAKRVQQYKETGIPLFQRYQVESQIDAIHNPTVHLKSGGYLVLNQTEALVAIDVNSGRSTRERSIEETATKTNLEASDEIGRQLRLRDLAGLVVIDFIDMDERRNQNKVEKRLKEALRFDRARIQVGRISTFGLMEMSRQRLRPSLGEFSTRQCPYCEGTGQIRSIESTSLHVLRAIEEEGIRKRSATLNVFVQSDIALYILNQKRATLEEIEARHGISVFISRDDSLIPPDYRMEGDKGTLAKEPVETGDKDRGRNSRPASPRRRSRVNRAEGEEIVPSKEPEVEAAPKTEAGSGDEESDGDPTKKRRRRGKRGGRRRGRRPTSASETGTAENSESENSAETSGTGAVETSPPAETNEDGAKTEEGADSKPVEKKRTRRSRGTRKPTERTESTERTERTESKEATGASEATGTTETAGEEEKKPRRSATRRPRKAKEEAKDSSEAKTGVSEGTKEKSAKDKDESKGDKPRGWWQRLVE
ncbi:MAG: Rne/Rng family ribonuclease, partial [Rhodospirillaceae bacterium]|nr:Rne/Rng family ribonuclease [Rhodospirillaceae bacterium]